MYASLPAAVARKVVKELTDLVTKRPCEGIRVEFAEENIREVHAEIDGPEGTPYEGGVFRMKLVMGQDFPRSPPTGHFLTKTFHPNISETGEICVNVLKKDWKPDLGLQQVLLTVRCLMIQPCAESALNEEAGRLLLEDYEAFSTQARLMTRIHATPLRPGGAEGRSMAGPRPKDGTAQCSPISAKHGCDVRIPAGVSAKRRALRRL